MLTYQLGDMCKGTSGGDNVDLAASVPEEGE